MPRQLRVTVLGGCRLTVQNGSTAGSPANLWVRFGARSAVLRREIHAIRQLRTPLAYAVAWMMVGLDSGVACELLSRGKTQIRFDRLYHELNPYFLDNIQHPAPASSKRRQHLAERGRFSRLCG